MESNQTDKVDIFMEKSDHPLKVEIEAVRNIIMNSESKISERVKWNAPSFFYKMDMAAFNLRQTKFVQLILIFPNGLVTDSSGLLQGEWKDRREARFYNIEDVNAKKKSIEKIVKEWVALMELKN